MTLSPFSKPTIAPKERWLKNAKAAEILGVDARTIKRWMKNPELRNALGAVRHGKQWRIPQPKSFNGDSEGAWESHARYNLKEIGIPLKARWQKALEESGRQFERNKLETYRLWLAAHLHLSVKPKAVTKEDITAILLLWQTVCEILESLPRGTEVDKLKSQFPERLKARDFSDERIHSIMSYWPDEKCFKIVHEAHTLEQLEIIRRRMDTMQAARTCENLGKKPTAKNLRPYLHKDIIEHINDTRDEPPKGFTVVKNPTADELHITLMASFCDQMRGNPPLPEIIDFRQPQNGLALRTFRNRHPLKKSPQKEIMEAVYDVQNSVPGVDERSNSDKTPVRGSKLSENLD